MGWSEDPGPPKAGKFPAIFCVCRRESVYHSYDRNTRRRLFNTLCHFLRVVDISHLTVCAEKHKDEDRIQFQSRLTKSIVQSINANRSFFDRYDELIVYYDNGQVELTRILVSVFNALFANVEFRKVRPQDYVLFQCADMICTLQLVAQKFAANRTSNSEKDFFNTYRDFKKRYMLHLSRKEL